MEACLDAAVRAGDAVKDAEDQLDLAPHGSEQ